MGPRGERALESMGSSFEFNVTIRGNEEASWAAELWVPASALRAAWPTIEDAAVGRLAVGDHVLALYTYGGRGGEGAAAVGGTLWADARVVATWADVSR